MNRALVIAAMLIACGGSPPQPSAPQQPAAAPPVVTPAPPPPPPPPESPPVHHRTIGEEAMAAAHDFADQVCACADHDDHECFKNVQQEMEQWAQQNASKMKDYAPTQEDLRQGRLVGDQMSRCIQKLMANPSAAGGRAITNTADYEATSTDLMAKLTAIVAADGKNCDKLGADLGGFFTDNKATIEASAAYETAHPDDKKAFEAKTKAQQAELGAKLGDAADTCRDNAAFKNALLKIPRGP